MNVLKPESNHNSVKRRVILALQQMANTPKTQIKRLALGTAIASLSMIALTATSHFESSWLFYILVSTTILGILLAIPGYIGIWVWRMRDVLFRANSKKL